VRRLAFGENRAVSAFGLDCRLDISCSLLLAMEGGALSRCRGPRLLCSQLAAILAVAVFTEYWISNTRRVYDDNCTAAGREGKRTASAT
jgi:hypothetical protein